MKAIRKLLICLLVAIVSGIIQVSAAFASELIGVEMVASAGTIVPNGIIEVEAGGEPVSFSIQITSDGNISGDGYFTVDTSYVVNGSSGSSGTPGSPINVTKSQVVSTSVNAFASASLNATPGDYIIRIQFPERQPNSLNDNTADYLTIRVLSDKIAPVFTSVPGDITTEATAVNTPVSIGTAIATDASGCTVTNDAPAAFQFGTTKVTWLAVDAFGNSSNAYQYVNIIDTTAPVFTHIPADIAVEAIAVNTPVSAADLGTATATDIFGATVSNNAPAAYPVGVTTVTWTATDSHNNTRTASQKVNIVDATKPVLTVPADVEAEAAGKLTEIDIGTASASDLFNVVITSDKPAAFPIGTTTVTWTATDANGNTSSATQRVTVQDSTKPILTVPADIIAEATGELTTINIGQATATDASDVTITSDQPAAFGLGETLVTWTAVDEFGNEASGTQKVTVRDTTKPVLSVPSDVEKEATDVLTPVSASELGTATATDYFNVTVTNNAPAAFVFGETTVIWTAVDANGNVSTATQTVKIIDKTAPVLTVPANMEVEATAVNTPVDIGEATATDIFTVTITSNAPAAYPIGSTTVTWSATDIHGNVTTGDQIITIVDTTKPVFTFVPEDIDKEATAVSTPIEIGMATATDIFGVMVTNNAPAGYPVGITTVTWTATDINGNVETATQTITVTDTTAPVLTVPADMEVEATAVSTPVVIGTATATDIFPVTITSNAPAAYPIGSTTVTWTATDSNGNVTTGDQIITIVDTTKPVFTFVPEDIDKEATAVSTPIEIGMATATDIFGVMVTNNTPAGYPVGITTVTWTATDSNGNVETATQTITVTDTTAPVLTVPADMEVEATAVNTPVEIGTATATDIFGVAIANNAPAAYPIGSTTVTWTATDSNGNVTTGDQIITIVDTTQPVFTFVPSDITVIMSGARTKINIGQATATDIFTPVTITNNAPSDFPIGTTIVTWEATDANGNTAEVDQKISVIYGFEGFLAPINVGNAPKSVFKKGSTIPIKFQLKDFNGGYVTNATANISISIINGTEDEDVNQPVLTSAATSGSLFRYDDNQYIYNLSTKNLTAGANYLITATLNDGMSYSVIIGLK